MILNNKTSRFDLKNALALAKASQLAYKNGEQIASIVDDEWHMKKFDFFEDIDTHTQAFICGDEDNVILTFRGTEANVIRDWLTDLQASFSYNPTGKVHSGFKRALNTIWSDVMIRIEQFLDNGQTFWVTGHSLGGALATLTVDRLLRKGFAVQGMYTFGQPRTGNKKFSQEFDRRFKHRSFRFVNNEDIVTRVPPRFLGYRHIGCVFYFDNDRYLHRGVGCWRNFLDPVTSIERRSQLRYDDLNQRFPGGADDDGIARYIRNIRASIRRAHLPHSFVNHINT